MNQPLVSILINNYNYGRFLRKAIDSALAQTYAPIEVIVVDDGSTDDSREILQTYGDRIRPILQINGGQASSFNAGFAASCGEIICLLDADDWFQPDKVARIVQQLIAHPQAGWCFHPVQLWEDTMPSPRLPEAYTGRSGYYDITADVERGKLSGTLPFGGTATSGLCFTRSLLSRILPMPQATNVTLSDDYLKYVAYGLTPGYVLLEELVVQRLHAQNAFTRRTDKHRLKAQIHVLTAHWIRHNFPQLRIFANNLFAAGRSLYADCDEIDVYGQAWIKQYWLATPWVDRAMIQLKTMYYQVKP
ncbi:glycosyltransferase family 2 protein [filamentous cyanobacterium LEGE 11480]|uniref:Glycosyltransferase family 2 protein n=1 Tax=Romeriopsis navalis LEGE 11480 TaxID=2777977 RepID=A0A928VQT1_9CYAN|nr:glycosyltransferase family 2 protein [Romeriopsis navalis]MBE9030419.1 glycosyltransferase family 2 protein [Romeriopsis navalis LEGE 11480]